MSKIICSGFLALMIAFSYAQSDTTLVFKSFTDSVIMYRSYSSDISEVSPVHYPKMQEMIMERQVTSWLNYDQEVYLSYEFTNYEHAPSDFGVLHRVVIGPDGAKAWSDQGEVVAEESMIESYYNPLYDNAVRVMLNESPDRANALPVIGQGKINQFIDLGFTHQIVDGGSYF